MRFPTFVLCSAVALLLQGSAISAIAVPSFLKPTSLITSKFSTHEAPDHPNYPFFSKRDYVAPSESSEACKNISRLTRNLWDSGLGDDLTKWMRTEMDYYKNDKKNSPDGYTAYLFKKFSPHVTMTSLGCNARDVCSIGKCSNVRQDIDPEDTRMAYYALDALSNFNNLWQFFTTQNRLAADQVTKHLGQFNKSFTWKDNMEMDQQSTDVGVEDLIQDLLLIIPSVATPLAGEVPLGVVDGNLNARHTPGYPGAASIGLRLANRTQEWHLGMDPFFNLMWPNLTARFDTHLTQIVFSVIRGEEDERGNDIVDLVSSGAFFKSLSDAGVQIIQKYLYRRWFAVALNYFWRLERLYIVAADAPGGCENDYRGPIAVRACLPEEPYKSFWGYGIDRGDEGIDHSNQATTHSIPGTALFDGEKFGGLLLEDVVRSSWGRYKKYLFGQIHARDAFVDPDPSDVLMTANFSGALSPFNIPVCLNDGGEAISSLNNYDDMHYPCICGNYPWRGGVDWTPAHDAEMVGFLTNSGLAASTNWQTKCMHKTKCDAYEDGKPWHHGQFPPKMKGDKFNYLLLKGPFYRCKRDIHHVHRGRLHYEWDYIWQKDWDLKHPDKTQGPAPPEPSETEPPEPEETEDPEPEETEPPEPEETDP